ncbi:TetR/AcrR family transcriptional regulator [Qipengyuania sp. XHP0207]|uniref:TetR/AcrR family transcriptional regulator n=1 Tax=Qipengyuania sp. XHP0207 TaxID=3038078 RepID=UPI00241FCE7A|nr:TetR/AcrR family transcriptional regulator [Qipengyuania sp. XHP0207]MDG5747153.1 TetR/AcrR family transcriptional regulator [Qipengyuania sp. XHP0207]
MADPPLSRETLLPRLAAHVLEHGLAGASLRPLARAAGTSDRMLIYHFGSKDGLVTALLEHVAGMYASALEMAYPTEPAASRRDCAQRLLAIGRAPMFASFLRLWWEIVAGAATGDAAFRASAAAMMDSQLAWFEAHLPPDDPDPKAGARLVALAVEGALMMDAIGLGEVGEAGLAALEG